jgi:hypothetical protein
MGKTEDEMQMAEGSWQEDAACQAMIVKTNFSSTARRALEWGGSTPPWNSDRILIGTASEKGGG